MGMSKLTLHGGHGSANHNCLKETKTKITDQEAANNRYWTRGDLDGIPAPLSDIDFGEKEYDFYKRQYAEYVANANIVALENRHPERRTTISKMIKSGRYKPHEFILQIGNMEDEGSVPPSSVLWAAACDMRDHIECDNIHFLNMALHAHEGTPHVHVRYVVDVVDKNGNRRPSLEQGLTQAGFARPDQTCKTSRYNCALQTFTDRCREYVVELVGRKNNLIIDNTVSERRRRYRSCSEHDRQELYTEMERVNERITKRQRAADKRLKATFEDIGKLSETRSQLIAEVEDLRRDNATLAIAHYLSDNPDVLSKAQQDPEVQREMRIWGEYEL